MSIASNAMVMRSSQPPKSADMHSVRPRPHLGFAMLSLLLQPLRQLIDSLRANDSPRQVAWGCTLGMVLGLLPKGNLIAVALGVLLCSLRINRSAGLAAAGIFTLVGPRLDSFSQLIGNKLLTEPALQPMWIWLYELPLGPWIGFNNTVVLGSLVMGIWMGYPCYWTAHLAWQRFHPTLADYVARYRVTRWLTGVSLAERLGG
jgi:uncharacterized protein (TIGR03546 family)